MSMEDHIRWFEVSDGTLSYKASLYEALKYTQNVEVIGGAGLLRMLDGTGLKQTNWQKLKITISGSGGVPIGLADLDYSGLITLKCGAPRAIIRPTNNFPVVPPHRTDTGYEPVVFKMVEGFWVPLTASGTGTKFMLKYYPQITCFMDPPQEGYARDESFPSSWSFTAEEA